jgi:hypothetical protein
MMEMERGLQEVMERVRTSGQGRCRGKDLPGTVKRRDKMSYGTLLEGLRSCGKRMTACQVSSLTWPEKSEAEVTFKELSDENEALSLEENPEATEAAVCEARGSHAVIQSG